VKKRIVIFGDGEDAGQQINEKGTDRQITEAGEAARVLARCNWLGGNYLEIES